jgi:hypothetical protein
MSYEIMLPISGDSRGGVIANLVLLPVGPTALRESNSLCKVATVYFR